MAAPHRIPAIDKSEAGEPVTVYTVDELRKMAAEMEIEPEGFVLSHDGAQNRAWLLKLARMVLSERAEGWMSSSVIPIFNGAVPNDLAETLEGAQEVETVLQQIRFGMF